MNTEKRGGAGTTAKICPPRQVEVFPRERLFRQLDKASAKPLIWIYGEPGAGKTTLVASYLHARSPTVLWYHFDATDEDIGTFFHYFSQAVAQTTAREFPSIPRLRPEHRPALEAFTRRYFEMLQGPAGKPLTLVFDNYHALPQDAPLHNVMRWGLDRLPESVRVIFISREDPPNTLARFESGRAMTIIGPEDLRLQLDEAKGISRLWPDWKPRQVRVPSLLRQSSGWMAGFILMLEKQTAGTARTADIQAMTQTSLFRYFAGEVFDQFEPKVKLVLMKSALLPRLVTATARSLTGEARAGDIIASMHERNYFTERAAGGALPEYQFHPLFREFLLQEADKRLGPERIRKLQVKAGAILEQAECPEDAADLFVTCGEWRSLARLCRQMAPALLEQGRYDTLKRWIAALPETELRADPWVVYWLGQCLLPFEPAQAREQFKSAYALFVESADKTGWLSASAAVIDAITFQWETFQGMDDWIDTMARFKLEVAADTSPHLKARLALSMFYALMFRRPHSPDIDHWGERALAAAEASGDPEIQLRVIEAVTHFHAWLGRLTEGRRLLLQAEQLVEAHSPVTMVTAGYHMQRAINAWHSGAFDEAIAQVETGLALTRREGIGMIDHRLLAQGVYACAGMGDLNAARGYLAPMADILRGRQYLDIGHFHMQRSWVELLSGNNDLAFEEARRSHELAEKIGTPFPMALSGFQFAQVSHVMNNGALAQTLLERSRSLATGMQSRPIQCLCGLLAAEMSLDAAEMDRCLEELKAAFGMMRSNHYVMLPCWRTDMLARLCGVALQHDIEPAFVRELISVHNLAPQTPEMAGPQWPWPLRVRTLGEYAIEVNGETITFRGKAQRKPMDFLRALIALGPADVDERALADLLWPDVDGDAAQQSLATTLHRTRKLLGINDVILRSQGRLSLNPALTWVDMDAFQRLLGRAEAACLDGGTEGERLLETALKSYTGAFLPDDEDNIWAISRREQLENRFGRALERLAAIHVEAGRIDNAIHWYEYGLEHAPLQETLYQGAMRVNLSAGKVAAASAIYRRCETFLTRYRGCQPSSDTKALLASGIQ